MKRKLVSIICLILVAVLVAACGGNSTTSDVSEVIGGVVSNTSGLINESEFVLSDSSSANPTDNPSYNNNSTDNPSYNTSNTLSDGSYPQSGVNSETVQPSVSSNSGNKPVSSTGNPNINISDSNEPNEDYGDINSRLEADIADRDDSAAPKTKVVNGKTYTLSFEDTFLGDELDSSKWVRSDEVVRQNLGGEWRDDMTEVHDGVLVLWAEMDGDTPVSGAVETQGKWGQTKGYFEAKIKLPAPPKCFWGGFWMMCGNVAGTKNGGKDGVEIDIMESIPNRSGSIQHNLHWDGYGSDHKDIGAKYVSGNFYSGWHTYAVEWTDGGYKFYVDDKCTLTVDNSHPSWNKLKGSCTAAGYMLLSIEFGTPTGFTSIQNDHLPSYMLVDWVRAYK